MKTIDAKCFMAMLSKFDPYLKVEDGSELRVWALNDHTIVAVFDRANKTPTTGKGETVTDALAEMMKELWHDQLNHTSLRDGKG